MINRFRYPVLVSRAEDSGLVVTCSDLLQLITQGGNKLHAIDEAVDAMDEVFADHIIGGLEFPVSNKAGPNGLWMAPLALTDGLRWGNWTPCADRAAAGCFRQPAASAPGHVPA